jgi:hypothetical protein
VDGVVARPTADHAHRRRFFFTAAVRCHCYIFADDQIGAVGFVDLRVRCSVVWLCICSLCT